MYVCIVYVCDNEAYAPQMNSYENKCNFSDKEAQKGIFLGSNKRYFFDDEAKQLPMYMPVKREDNLKLLYSKSTN